MPHFKVKCHKSRTNKERTYTNDKYFADEFDIVFVNPANAFIQPRDYVLRDDKEAVEYLKKHYGTNKYEDVLPLLTNEIYFALTSDLEENDGTIPRTPTVQFDNDPIWKKLDQLEKALLVVVKRKLAASTRRPTRPAYLTD